MSRDKHGIKHGYRSGFEKEFLDNLKESGLQYKYEGETIEYIQPEKKRKYTPDIVFEKRDGTKMYIELKGRWVTADRMKHVYIKQTYPDIDIRFIFCRPNQTLSKTSKTTYYQYCKKRGWPASPFPKKMPSEWLEELK